MPATLERLLPPAATPGELHSGQAAAEHMAAIQQREHQRQEHVSGIIAFTLLTTAWSPLLCRSAPGTIATIVAPRLYATCEACADGYYRAGDAYANNNVCKQIPAGKQQLTRCWLAGMASR